MPFEFQDLVDDYRCVCPDGWEGKDCMTETDECAVNPCVQGECVVRTIT